MNVNDLTRHAPGNVIVNVFYNKSIAKDIGILILKDSEVWSINIYKYNII